jgi:hypothetical protein
LPFLPFLALPEEYLGRVKLAPRVAGAKSSFAVSLRSFSAGDKKSILKASFFSRLGLEAATASVVSAVQTKVLVEGDSEIEKEKRTSSYGLA